MNILMMTNTYIPIVGGLERSIEEHQAILDAVRAGDASEAGTRPTTPGILLGMPRMVEGPRPPLPSQAQGGALDGAV